MFEAKINIGYFSEKNGTVNPYILKNCSATSLGKYVAKTKSKEAIMIASFRNDLKLIPVLDKIIIDEKSRKNGVFTATIAKLMVKNNFFTNDIKADIFQRMKISIDIENTISHLYRIYRISDNISIPLLLDNYKCTNSLILSNAKKLEENGEFRKAFVLYYCLIVNKNSKQNWNKVAIATIDDPKENRNYNNCIFSMKKRLNKDPSLKMYDLGQCYYYGLGVKENYTKAAKLLKSALPKLNKPYSDDALRIINEIELKAIAKESLR